MSLPGTGDEPRTRADWPVGPGAGFRVARVRVGALDEGTRPGSGDSGTRPAAPAVSRSGVRGALSTPAGAVALEEDGCDPSWQPAGHLRHLGNFCPNVFF